jgi:hypothetical protein
MNDNNALWSRVEKTDPKYTKQFSRSGGFKGTATNATYLAMKATQTFGPCGIGWGINVLSEQFVEGAPLDGGVRAVVHKLHVRLWYILDGVRGEIEHFGQTDFVYSTKSGLRTDEEAPKKSLTDAMSKCLSLLGFSADIHMGRYDDNKYVASLQDEFESAEAQPWIEKIDGAKAVEELEAMGPEIAKAPLSTESKEKIRAAYSARKHALAPAKAAA